ncbi:glycerol-3-phosphate dehydrogenase C-terminal domain-containing protein, partial [Burkholderia vietnamiensis]|uniref:glycerol-3-phosphate dehydrogenase C-terminal domain-containing protein n=1 Tax=Burkholderia vietnamiensis TaxID=60552 RepID=UPI002445ABEA
ASKYGSNVDELFNIAQTAQYHTSKLPLEIYVELIYGIQQEMVFKPTDFLVRRSGKLYFNIDDVLQYKDAVIDVLADMLQYSEGQKQAYTDEVNKAIDEAQSGNNQPAVKQ